ncbi:hypothetical protein SAMN02743940_0478 [Nitrosomonas cryotolerans ATCC 49181]|uniref:Uncharacterized protein n=1 Tax=Nitrosomonas cryotolerans ATCC 49181 TaxID=1131553 RepID=A0A1N6FZJ7_9PROT|nr:hypothetical protein SAMN02743940_0478 [Nitrosomonas cryotolerans ATCC 49181]
MGMGFARCWAALLIPSAAMMGVLKRTVKKITATEDNYVQAFQTNVNFYRD